MAQVGTIFNPLTHHGRLSCSLKHLICKWVSLMCITSLMSPCSRWSHYLPCWHFW